MTIFLKKIYSEEEKKDENALFSVARTAAIDLLRSHLCEETYLNRFVSLWVNDRRVRDDEHDSGASSIPDMRMFIMMLEHEASPWPHASTIADGTKAPEFRASGAAFWTEFVRCCGVRSLSVVRQCFQTLVDTKRGGVDARAAESIAAEMCAGVARGSRGWASSERTEARVFATASIRSALLQGRGESSDDWCDTVRWSAGACAWPRAQWLLASLPVGQGNAVTQSNTLMAMSSLLAAQTWRGAAAANRVLSSVAEGLQVTVELDRNDDDDNDDDYACIDELGKNMTLLKYTQVRQALARLVATAARFVFFFCFVLSFIHIEINIFLLFAFDNIDVEPTPNRC